MKINPYRKPGRFFINTAVGGFVFVLSLAFAGMSLAAPGDLDDTFGTGGKVTTDFNNHTDSAYGLAIQSDGKIVAAGVSYYYNYIDYFGAFALARYNPDGSLDTTFGTEGKVLTDFNVLPEFGALAIQPNGKIIVAGASFSPYTTGSDFALARFNPGGSPDGTVGTGG